MSVFSPIRIWAILVQCYREKTPENNFKGREILEKFSSVRLRSVVFLLFMKYLSSVCGHLFQECIQDFFQKGTIIIIHFFKSKQTKNLECCRIPENEHMIYTMIIGKRQRQEQLSCDCSSSMPKYLEGLFWTK